MENINQIISSKTFKYVFGLLVGLMAILLAFALRIRVGLHKARYSYQWGANYERNFLSDSHRMMGDIPMPPRGPMDFHGMPSPDMMRNANGMAGSIISIKDNLVVIKDRESKENTVSISDKTIIKSGREDITLGDLRVDERIVVIGDPGDNGVVNADLIRVFNN